MGARVGYVFRIGCTAMCRPPHAFKQYPSHPCLSWCGQRRVQRWGRRRVKHCRRRERESSRQKWNHQPLIFSYQVQVGSFQDRTLEGVIISQPSWWNFLFFRPHLSWVCVKVVQVFPQLRLHNVIYQPDMFDPHTVTFPCSFAIQPPSLILGLRGSGPIIPGSGFPTKSPPSTSSSQCHTSYQPDLFKPHKVTFLVLPNSHLHSSVTLNMQSSCYVQRKGIQFESSRFVHLQLDVLPSLGSGPFLWMGDAPESCAAEFAAEASHLLRCCCCLSKMSARVLGCGFQQTFGIYAEMCWHGSSPDPDDNIGGSGDNWVTAVCLFGDCVSSD